MCAFLFGFEGIHFASTRINTCMGEEYNAHEVDVSILPSSTLYYCMRAILNNDP